MNGRHLDRILALEPHGLLLRLLRVRLVLFDLGVAFVEQAQHGPENPAVQHPQEGEEQQDLDNEREVYGYHNRFPRVCLRSGTGAGWRQTPG